jgi:hypothetical protein
MLTHGPARGPARLVSRILSFRLPDVGRKRAAAPRTGLPSSLSLTSAGRAFPSHLARLAGLVRVRILDPLCERESERQTADLLFGPREKLRIVDVPVDRARAGARVALGMGRARVGRAVLVGIRTPLSGDDFDGQNQRLLRGPERDRVSAVAAADHPVGGPLSAVRASPLTHPHPFCRRRPDRHAAA